MGETAICCRTAGLSLILGLSGTAFAQVGFADSPTPNTEDTAKLDEIVVTGSLIRGTEAAGSKLIVIGREQIDASGYGRIEDVLATVTQNFSRVNGAVSGGDHFNNANRGAEVQLRGLGPGTTLTLINGQRQGQTGDQGMFTDVSTIPASAVERVEILPEGAAALYGSDAIGGVVNIVLRTNFNGFETRLRASTARGDANEREFAQLWGHAWSRGHLLLGFQYNDSAALACGARAYCAANADYRRFGGSDLRGVGGNPGTIIVDPDTLAPVAAIPHGQDGTQLTAAQLIPGTVNYTNIVNNNDIIPSQTMRSAFMSASYRPADNFEIFFDGRYSSRVFKSTFPQPAAYLTVPVGNAFNHLGAPVVVAYDFTPDLGPVVDSGPTDTFFASAGFKRVLPGGWQARVAGAYSKSRTEFVEANYFNQDAVDVALNNADPTVALNVFGDGSHTSATTLRRLSTRFEDVNEFTTTSANVIADGPLVDGAAGAIRLAVGGDYRKEHDVGTNIAGGEENRGRQVAAAFFELSAPILAGHQGSNTGRLGLSVAGRYESYSDAGTTFNPKVGLSWQPLRLLKLRGTWGTSFRAPPFFYSNADQFGDVVIYDVVDPRSPTGHTHALALFGPIPNLQPETARAGTVGMDVTLPATPVFSLSLTYFDIDYQGKIQSPGPEAAVFLIRESEFSSLVTRNPTQTQIDAVCKKPPLYGGNCTQQLDAILDNRARNLASVKTRGVDATLNYSNDATSGKWVYGLNGTYTFDQKQQITPTAPVFDYANTVGNPLRLRLAGHLTWTLRRWTVQATVNYTGGYRDPGSVPPRRVDSWTTADLNIGYQVEGVQGPLANTQINLGIVNFLNQRPPFVNRYDMLSGTLGYDAANAAVLGRQVSLQLVKNWGR